MCHHSLSIVLLVGACTYSSQLPRVELDENFSENGEAQAKEQWWRTIQDPALQQLINDALAGNFGYKQAWARLDQAAAVRKNAVGDRLPRAFISGGASHEITADDDASAFSASAAATYEVDIWGRYAAAARSAGNLEIASSLDLQVFATTLAGEMATAWYTYVAAQAQLRLLDDQLKTANQIEKLVEFRYRAGQAQASDVYRQRQFTEALRLERISFVAVTQQQRNAINALRGLAPRHGLPATSNIEMPPLPKTGVPSKIIFARPDVQAAFARLRAADARVEAAMRARYPAFSISASIGGRSASASSLLDNWFVNLAANVLAPIFQGGQLQAEVDRQKAAAREAAYRCGEAIVEAARDIEDAIAEDVRRSDSLKSTNRQMDLAQEAVVLLTRQFAKGQVDYLRVLDGLTTQQRLARQQIQSILAQRLARIHLYRVLAANPQAPRPKDKQ